MRNSVPFTKRKTIWIKQITDLSVFSQLCPNCTRTLWMINFGNILWIYLMICCVHIVKIIVVNLFWLKWSMTGKSYLTKITLLGLFLYARLKNGRIMPWQCPSVRLSVRPSVRPGFPDFSSTCFEISIWNLVYTFSGWHDMSSLSCITIGSLWPSLQPKVGQTHFLQSWPHKSR